MQPRVGMWPFKSEGVNLMGGNIGWGILIQDLGFSAFSLGSAIVGF